MDPMLDQNGLYPFSNLSYSKTILTPYSLGCTFIYSPYKGVPRGMDIFWDSTIFNVQKSAHTAALLTSVVLL